MFEEVRFAWRPSDSEFAFHRCFFELYKDWLDLALPPVAEAAVGASALLEEALGTAFGTDADTWETFGKPRLDRQWPTYRALLEDAAETRCLSKAQVRSLERLSHRWVPSGEDWPLIDAGERAALLRLVRVDLQRAGEGYL